MTAYSNFTKDFVIRTISNLDSYNGDFEVTNLINCCLGLIIIPKAKVGKDIPTYTFTADDRSFGITKKNIIFVKEKNYRLTNILRHIRNGLAHGRIEQKTSQKKIVGLKICDEWNGDLNFIIEFTIPEFQEFAIKISNLVK